MAPGDYYDLEGKQIGTDGIDDRMKYVVYNQAEAKQIENTKEDYTGVVNGKVNVGSSEMISAIADAVTRSNNLSYTGQLAKNETATGGFTETGVTGTNFRGGTIVTVAQNGPPSGPKQQDKAEISLPQDFDIRVHVHPSGEILETKGGSRSEGTTTVIGIGSTGGRHFNQQP